MNALELKALIHQVPPARFTARAAAGVYRTARREYLKRRYPQGRYLQCNGIRVFCHFHDPTYEWYDGPQTSLAFDQAVLAALLRQSRGDTVIDIGAHFGFFTAFLCSEMRKMTRPMRMIALEPDRSHYRCLLRTAEGFSNAIVLPVALSATDGKVGMHDSSGSCLRSYGGSSPRYFVEGMSLESVVRAHGGGGRVALIKIDVDGTEPSLFAGGINVLREHSPIVFMEFAPRVLEGAGIDVAHFYRDLCGNFCVRWADAKRRSTPEVGPASLAEILAAVGEGVTDLILSSHPLPLGTLSPRPCAAPGRAGEPEWNHVACGL